MKTNKPAAQARKSPVRTLSNYGQSVWLDYIHRDLIRSGELRRMIEEDGLCGVTSNPTIFEKAIAHGTTYDADIKAQVDRGRAAAEILTALIVQDIQEAADLFADVYQRTAGRDGYVSIEVSPHLARDTQGTIDEARRLWQLVSRPNIFVKIPGTLEGLSAIQQCLADEININVTLLFSLPRYLRVAEAYVAALEERAAKGLNVERVASVASFFVSRIDSLVDPMLERIKPGRPGSEIAQLLRGQSAIFSAKVAYRMYEEIFGTAKFVRLAGLGAQTQRLLWASTGTKNPAYCDVKYVEALIGPETVNTIPQETLQAYRDHGDPAPRLMENFDEANSLLSRLSALGIMMNDLTDQLEQDGIEKFVKSYDDLLAALRAKGARD